LKIVLIILGLIVIWFLRLYLKALSHKVETDAFLEEVVKYKVVEKYYDGLKWALYLYTNKGNEQWNETISESFAARDADKGDLTMVFHSFESAKDYADSFFVNATQELS